MSPAPTKNIELACHAPKAKAVSVAGTFNNWNPDSAPLRLNPKTGMWFGQFQLAPGRHEFKFVVDGRWCCEPGCEHEHRGCPKCVTNAFGTMNRLLTVS